MHYAISYIINKEENSKGVIAHQRQKSFCILFIGVKFLVNLMFKIAVTCQNTSITDKGVLYEYNFKIREAAIRHKR